MSSYAWDITRSASALALICLIILGIYLLLKKHIIPLPQVNKSDHIPIESIQRLSPKHALWIVSIDSIEHLIATSDEGHVDIKTLEKRERSS